MPVVWLDRLPLPNLKTYTCVSVVALSVCIYFAVQVIRDPDWELAVGGAGGGDVGKSLFQMATGAGGVRLDGPDVDVQNRTNGSDVDRRSMGQWMSQVCSVMVKEPICVWTVINMAFCWLILMGRCVQKLVFGELRVSEQQHLKDKFWNFIFYKFIFIFGIVNVQYVDEVLLWCSWFALLGFLQLLSLLASDRFEYLSFSPTTPIWSHAKLLGLLAAIFALSGFMFVISIFVGFFGGLNTFAFMSAEVILLGIRSLHVIIRYGIHLYEMRYDDNEPPITATSNNGTTITSTGRGWHQRGGPITYYTNLGFDLMALAIDFLHHTHMLVWSNILLSMASLVVCMQLRFLMNEIQRKVKRHRNYLWVRDHLERNYPMASCDEIASNSDNCAICWEKMEEARKLPCSHLFHNACLQSWLEQDKSCPTCRLVLTTDGTIPGADNDNLSAMDLGLGGDGDAQMAPQQQQQQQQQAQAQPPTRPHHHQLQHFFHFDASRYVSWLPSFSVEVSHATNQMMQRDLVMAARTSQLEEMARQVQQLFPHMPLSSVVADLRLTYSAELTIENILDGRVVAPPQRFRELSDTTAANGGGTPPALVTSSTTTTATGPFQTHRSTTTTTTASASAGSASVTSGLTGAGLGHVTSSTSAADELCPADGAGRSGGGCWEDDIDTEDTITLGSRFSKSSTERERILHKRKELLIHEARKRYLEKQSSIILHPPNEQQS